jgi:hypothetical protein
MDGPKGEVSCSLWNKDSDLSQNDGGFDNEHESSVERGASIRVLSITSMNTGDT